MINYIVSIIAIIMLIKLAIMVIKYILNRKKRKLPYGNVYESGGGLQCCCPICAYGVGTQDTFIENHSKIVIRTCATCKTQYQSLVISSIPVSGRSGW